MLVRATASTINSSFGPKSSAAKRGLHVIGCLKQANAARSFEGCLHQSPSDIVTLSCRIRDEGTDRPDRITLAKKVETDDPAIIMFGLGNHRKDRRMFDETSNAPRSNLYEREDRSNP
jgi:hypothetical protein